MRYFLVFLGGLLAGVLLFLLMRELAFNEPPPMPGPKPEVTLHTPELEPPEPEPREPREAPEKPEAVEPPPTGIDPTEESEGEHPPLPPHPGPGGPERIRLEPGDYLGGGAGSGMAVCNLMVAPNYPLAAARGGIEGKVELAFTIRTDGSVGDVTVISATPRGVFEQAARQAVARWKCSAPEVDGRPQPQRVRQVLEFNLQQDE